MSGTASEPSGPRRLSYARSSYVVPARVAMVHAVMAGKRREDPFTKVVGEKRGTEGVRAPTGDVMPIVTASVASALIERAGIGRDDEGRWILPDDERTTNVRAALNAALVVIAEDS
jgi:hypothetical protein